MPYGHINYSKTGIIDFYFQKFIKYQREYPNTDLITWSKDIINREKFKKENKIKCYIF